MLEALDVDAVDTYAGWPAYEWVRAVGRFAADPAHPANERIVDLDLAPRHDDGLVRYDADVRILRPSGDGNGRLLLLVPNRGMLGGVPFSLDAPVAWGPSEDLHPGDGFLLEQGWTIAWCGWQWDVPRQPGMLGLTAPVVELDEPGWMRVEWRPDADHDDHALSDTSALFTFADHPTADRHDPDARLLTRTSPVDDWHELPRASWHFPDDTHVALDGGFRAFHWYQLRFRTPRSPVAGCGLLAVRDLVADLRLDHDHAFAYGVSQSGRFLRQLLFDGCNVDEAGRPVFDGVFSHIASARRGEFNRRHAQPGLTHPMGPDYGPPYDTAGLLERQRTLGGAPKVLFTNTAWEYWRGDGALVHVDPDTGGDLPEDPDARTYLLAGADHLGPFPVKDAMPGANPAHQLEVSPVLRALFTGLVRWVTHGEAPPPSQVPRRADGTAVERHEVLRRFTHVPTPDPATLPVTDGAVALVAAVDDDGNELAGIRLPEVAAPVAAYAGWNPRRPVDGLPDVLYEFLGSRLPFPPGRPSAQDRYGDLAGYEEAAHQAAETLVAGGFLLGRDIDRTVGAALKTLEPGGFLR